MAPEETAILGLDIGTTSAKAVLFDLNGQALAAAQQVIALQTPQPGWAEQDPEEVWGAVIAAIKGVVEQAGPTCHIAALSLASQGGSLLPVDRAGWPVYPVITWMDSRAAGLVAQWQRDGTGRLVRDISGWHPQPGLTLATLAWLQQHRPEVCARADRYFAANDFIIHRLTGRFCTDLTCANEMLFMEVASGRWSDTLCGLAGIRPEQLSEPQPSGSVVGPITPEVSRQTGLPPDTVVVNGGHDHCCESLALGITAPGQLLLTCGTAWVITGVIESPAVESIPEQLDLNFHVLPERWTISQFLGGLGAVIEWWLNQHWQTPDPAASLSREQLYAYLDAALAHTRPGSGDLFFLPLGGSLQVAGGSPRGGFIGLRLDHSRAEMSRAILEGAAFELRWALEKMRQAGLPVSHLWLLGGATRSPHWPQILADVAGVPLSTTRYAHWAALGAAILAGAGAGLFDSLAAGQARFGKTVQAIQPDEQLRGFYGDRFATYQHLNRAVS